MRSTVWQRDLWLPLPSIVLGALLWAISINGILVHHRLLSGGISGLALVIYYLVPKLSIGLMVFLINIPLFIMGWTMISGKFLAFSLLGMGSFSLFLHVTTKLQISVENPLLACLFAGVISGVGSGLIFRAGGSGGGTGIIAMVLNRRFSVRVGLVSFLLNSVPLVLGAFLMDLDAALYSIIYVYTSGSVMDQHHHQLQRAKKRLDHFFPVLGDLRTDSDQTAPGGNPAFRQRGLYPISDGSHLQRDLSV